MKFNFKKIASVLTSTVMLSSTIAFAAAASFPAPFVNDGVGDYAVVVGSGANTAAGDATAVQSINDYLLGKVTETTEAPVTVDGESFMIADGDDMFNLGENAAAIDDELDLDDFPTLLADGTYTNEPGDDFEYDQILTLSGDLAVNAQLNDDDDMYIGMQLEDADSILNYTLTFDNDVEGGADFDNLEETYITMLGKEYYISGADAVDGVVQITLLDSANKVTLTKGESTTVTVGDESYDVTATYIHSTNGVKLTVDGVELGTLDEDGTKTRKLADGTYVTLLENLAGEDADADSAVVSFGNGEIVLTNGEEVEINDDIISDSEISAYYESPVNAYIVNDSTDITSITLEWILGDDVDLESGDELVLPGFETVKVVMGDFVTFTEETVSFVPDSDFISVTVPFEDEEYELPILWSNGTSFRAVGEDNTKLLRTSASSVLTFTDSDDEFENDYFVVTRSSGDEVESFILTLDDIDDATPAKNTTTLKNLVTGDAADSADIGETLEIGEDITIKVLAANAEDHSVSLNITSSDTSWNKVATAEGLVMTLPVDTISNAASNFSAEGESSWAMTLTEETGDEDGEGQVEDGTSFTVTLGFNSANEPEVTGTSLNEQPETEDSDIDVAYVASELATKVALDTEADQQTLEVTYHGGESYAKAYIAAGDATSSSGGNSGTLIVTDTEVSDVDSKNLIVVGGTCVNKVAAKVLGVEDQYPVCGDAWESLTTVGAGEFLIQTVVSPYSNSKVAMLVAGYNQPDTKLAADALETETIDTSSGKKYVQGAGSTLSLV